MPCNAVECGGSQLVSHAEPMPECAPHVNSGERNAAVTMGPIDAGAQWDLEFWVANRGNSTEFFQVQLVRGYPGWETILSSGYTVHPLKAVGYALGAEADPGITAWEMWWARIFTTSLNLVPTMRFHVQNPPGPMPQVFFSPGDFAVFPYQPLQSSTDTSTGTNAGTA
jgi:hypothetical protein